MHGDMFGPHDTIDGMFVKPFATLSVEAEHPQLETIRNAPWDWRLCVALCSGYGTEMLDEDPAEGNAHCYKLNELDNLGRLRVEAPRPMSASKFLVINVVQLNIWIERVDQPMQFSRLALMRGIDLVHNGVVLGVSSNFTIWTSLGKTTDTPSQMIPGQVKSRLAGTSLNTSDYFYSFSSFFDIVSPDEAGLCPIKPSASALSPYAFSASLLHALSDEVGAIFPMTGPILNVPPISAEPFILIVGCGYSGTRALASFLSENLGIFVEHEFSDEKHGLAVSPGAAGVASWLATARLLDVPPGKRVDTFMMVRHPLSVARSARDTAWSFEMHTDHLGRNASIIVSEWVPRVYAAVWARLSREARALLWWASFNLLGEAQLPPRRRPFRMEDVFGGNVDAVRDIAASHFGTAKAFDWEAIGARAAAAPKRNEHARAAAPEVSWAELAASVEARSDCAVRVAETAILHVAKHLCVKYGYSQWSCE